MKTEIYKTFAECDTHEELICSTEGLKFINTLLSNENQSNEINTKWRQESMCPDPRWEFVKDMLLENRTWKKRQNVRANNLIVGNVYLMKKRNISDQLNYENDTTAVRFLGVRNTDTGEFVGVNIPVSKLDRKNNDANIQYDYMFETFYANNNGECKDTEPRFFGAYAWNGSLAINSGAINVSFFKVNTSGFMNLLNDTEFYDDNLQHLESVGSFFNTKTGVFYAATTNNRVDVLGDIWVPDFTTGVSFQVASSKEWFDKLSKKDHQIVMKTKTKIWTDWSKVQLHLKSKEWEWEMDKDLDVIIFNDYSEFNEDTDVRLYLPTSLFNKEVFHQPRWSQDPTDVQSNEGVNITDVGDDYTDEWDSSEIAEVFFKNIDKIQIIKN